MLKTLVKQNSANALLFNKTDLLCGAYGHPKYRYNEHWQCEKVS